MFLRQLFMVPLLSGAMRVALGGQLSGVFTNSSPMYEELRKAGVVTGDRVWRFPLIQAFSKNMTGILLQLDIKLHELLPASIVMLGSRHSFAYPIREPFLDSNKF